MGIATMTAMEVKPQVAMAPAEALARGNKGEALVQVDHLTKRFGNFTAVDDISFQVSRGEIFGFLGPNGAGKSTTIKMICTLLPLTEGQILVAGHDVADD